MLRRAAEYCRARKGPALVHAQVTRPYSHSLSDDEKLYKTHALREEEAHRDPIPKFGLFLVREGIVDEKELEAIEAEVDREVREASDQALAAELPAKESILVNQYSPDVDPTSSRFESAPQFSGEPRTMVEMVSATLADEMARDERIVVLGEDVADCSNEEDLEHLKGKGGVFKATVGLAAAFWIRARLQYADCGGLHRRQRAGHGRARLEACRGDSVFRLHLAGDDAAAQRIVFVSLALERSVQGACRDSRGYRRLSDWRSDLSQPERGSAVHAHSGDSRGHAFDRARSLRLVAHGDSLRRSRAVSGTQASVPPALQSVSLSWPGLHRFRSGARASRGKATT